MRPILFIVLVYLVSGECITQWDDSYGSQYIAKVVISKDPNSTFDVSGQLFLHQSSADAKTQVLGQISGLKDGTHGFHIHTSGDIGTNCTGALSHYNPFNRTHGGPYSVINHVGDLGNIVSQNGNATVNTSSSQIQLSGLYSVVGRAFVVHADTDDYGLGGQPDSNTTGHAGARLGCGQICYFVSTTYSSVIRVLTLVTLLVGVIH